MIFADGAEETCEETGPFHAGLWARVRHWLATWTAIFPPEEILRDGLTRRLALRCCNWLWPLEAAVRRLIVAAALAFDAAKLSPASPQQRSRKPEKHPPSPLKPAGFRILSLRGAGEPRGAISAARSAGRAERHLPFPSDDLLRLGSPPSRHHPKLVVRRDNPLHRHGRIRPTDPDYRPGSEADDSSELHPGTPGDRTPQPERERDAGRGLCFRIPLKSDDSEWRRIEKEWERILPAPGIAARITALAGVLGSPGPHIRRLARRLATEPGLAALLRAAPPPLLRKPKYDSLGPQVEEDLTLLAHAALYPPDTS